ncbi:unnamed protein product [Bursaphelenchus okinawaensis]|uniref:G_PROTEIN_RECEP_F1_2 domain-containing protein n=1 Tax=Bursaphelenchus okinawaensis TaxID=465554 RepID=A0A811KVR2_9BILA|nr:unnamed protein product [Bursaphelenchus okinawaensis]CAG9114093.1 unnamed protein product [Bursaphelenchus okinawaensis]
MSLNVPLLTKLIDAFGLLLCVYSVISCIFFVFIVCKSKSVHGNLRGLLILVSFEFRLIAVSRFLADMFTSLWDNRTYTTIVCNISSFLHAFGFGFVQLAFATVIIERAMATKYHQSYDDWDTKLTRVLLALLFTYAVCYACAVVYMGNSGYLQEQFESCLLMVRYPMFLVFCWVVFGITMILGVLPTVYLYTYNKKMSEIRANGTLKTRYQYHDNVVVLKIMTPLVVFGVFGVGCVCIMVIGTAWLRMMNGERLDSFMFMLFKREPDSEPEVEPGSEPELKPHSEPKPELNPKLEHKLELDLEFVFELELKPEPTPEPNFEFEPKSELEANVCDDRLLRLYV